MNSFFLLSNRFDRILAEVDEISTIRDEVVKKIETLEDAVAAYRKCSSILEFDYHEKYNGEEYELLHIKEDANDDGVIKVLYLMRDFSFLVMENSPSPDNKEVFHETFFFTVNPLDYGFTVEDLRNDISFMIDTELDIFRDEIKFTKRKLRLVHSENPFQTIRSL